MTERQALPLPLEIDEIDREWLTVALRTRAPDVAVKNFQIVDVIPGTSTKIRLRLEMDAAGHKAGIPDTVILKGGFEDHSRRMAFMYEMEARGYRDVYSVLQLRTPVCYFSDYDPQRLQGIVIMEDLAARGVSFCDLRKPQTREQVARRLSALAAFHAQTWDSPEFAAGGRWEWLPGPTGSEPPYVQRYLVPHVWNGCVASPRGASASVRFHDVDWMGETLDRLYTLSMRRPHCIVHGDTHLGNLYIEPDGTPGFFDSLPSHQPWAAEISYHITAALDIPDRAEWERSLVQHYLDELRRHGVDAPAIGEAMEDYAMFLARGYYIWLVNDTFYQPEANNTACTARFSAAMVDNNTKELISRIS